MLTPEEIARYKRQLVLKEIGGEGQQKLKAARVLVVGAGGIGSPLILYLAAAGTGEIGIIDGDRVSLDNLQRQIVHDTKSVGRSKTKSAASAIERLNLHVQTRLYSTRLVPENALEIVRGFDIVADGSDNFATRYLVNDACYFAQRPLAKCTLSKLRFFNACFCSKTPPIIAISWKWSRAWASFETTWHSLSRVQGGSWKDPSRTIVSPTISFV